MSAYTLKMTPEEEKLAQGLLPERLPRHVAMIMDGNGRWAEGKGWPRTKGHEQGIKRVEDILKVVNHFKIPYVTLYTFSKENWKRPADEVSFLMRLFKVYLRKNLKKFEEDDVVFKAIGDLNDFDPELRSLILRGIEETKDHKGITLTLALSYGGRQELIEGVRSLLREGFPPDRLTEEVLASRLSPLPDVDFLIRTSGETRISNFLPWHLSYAELYFTPVLWPDFGTKAFLEALRAFQNRDRRFGNIL